MTVSIITSAWTYFQRIQKDDFTGLIRHSLAMTQLITDFNKDDKKRLEWLRTYTHVEIMRSMYELDRYVNPTKGKYSNQRWTFNDGKVFSQDDIQRFLCLAVEEATQIVYRNFKDFKTETKIGLDSYEDELAKGEEDW